MKHPTTGTWILALLAAAAIAPLPRTARAEDDRPRRPRLTDAQRTAVANCRKEAGMTGPIDEPPSPAPTEAQKKAMHACLEKNGLGFLPPPQDRKQPAGRQQPPRK